MTVISAVVAFLAATVWAASHSRSSNETRHGDGVDSDKCVKGFPSQNGHYDMFYQIVKPNFSDAPKGYIIDEAWKKNHSSVGSTLTLSLGDEAIPYGESRCQYSCNGQRGCVAYAAYRTKVSIGFECDFFDDLIQETNFDKNYPANSRILTNAFNKICVNESQEAPTS